MYRKNVAGQYLYFGLVNAADGAALTGATVTGKRAIDGAAQASVTGTISEEAGGQYKLALSQADTNGNNIGYLFTATGAIPVNIDVVTTTADPTDAAAFGLSRLDAAVSSRSTYAGADTAGTTTLLARLTATRAGLLDNLDLAVSGVAAAVWAAATRTLSAFGFTVATTDAASIAAVKAKTDNLPASPAAVSDIPTAVQNSAAVVDQALAGHTTVGTVGAALAAAGSAGDPWATPLPGAYGAGTAGEIIGNLPDANANADALLDRAAGVETNRTVRQALRLMLASLAGKLSGAGGTQVKIRDTNDTKDRITATVDNKGNRSAVGYDAS